MEKIKKILITGGNGYIGSRLSIYLANKGYEVTPLCFPEIPQDESWIKMMYSVLCGDIRDNNFIKKVSKNNYDAIIHLISLDHCQSSGDPFFVSSINITPTWCLLENFSKTGLKNFIYFSTMQVYGELPETNISENYPPNTVNAYALTHLMCEQFCEHYNRNSQVKCNVLRLSNSYGAPVFIDNNCWHLVINDLCKTAYAKKEIILQSDGSPQRDFIHGWDVARAVETILNSENEQMIYNVSSGKTMTILEIALKIKQVYQLRYNENINIFTSDGIVNPPLDIKSSKYTIDNSRLSKLGYETEWDLDKGINDLFQFLEKNQQS